MIEVLFIGWAPSGPWEDESFTGVFGLLAYSAFMSAGLDGNLEQMG